MAADCPCLRLESLASDAVLGSGPPSSPCGRSLSPPPWRLRGCRAGEPQEGAQVWPRGATRRRAGERGVIRVAEPGVGVEGTGPPPEGTKRATSRFPPSLRLLQLKRVFPVGLLSGSALPSLPEPAWRSAPPRPGLRRLETWRLGPRVGLLERREGAGPGFQQGLQISRAFSHPVPHSDLVGPQGVLEKLPG